VNHYVLVTQTLIRQASLESPEVARRRERLFLLEMEVRRARRRRRRERIRRVWSTLVGVLEGSWRASVRFRGRAWGMPRLAPGPAERQARGRPALDGGARLPMPSERREGGSVRSCTTWSSACSAR